MARVSCRAVCTARRMRWPCWAAGRRALARPRVLVGGLGMGFTLRAALDVLPPTALIVVAELVPEVVAWNRGPIGGLANHPLRDPRVRVEEQDVAVTLRSNAAYFDAVLLDVDNGPAAMTSSSNAGLYTRAGIARIRAALRPGGVMAVWSARDHRRFERTLRDGGFSVRRERVSARMKKGARGDTILVARAGKTRDSPLEQLSVEFARCLLRPAGVSLRQHLDREQRAPPGEIQGLLVRAGKREVLRALRGRNQSERLALRAEHLDTGLDTHVDSPLAVDRRSRRRGSRGSSDPWYLPKLRRFVSLPSGCTSNAMRYSPPESAEYSVFSSGESCMPCAPGASANLVAWPPGRNVIHRGRLVARQREIDAVFLVDDEVVRPRRHLGEHRLGSWWIQHLDLSAPSSR